MADEERTEETTEEQVEETKEETTESPDPAAEVEKWKALSRKNEKAAERERKEREKADKALKERDEADQSDQEKALTKAREEARNEALTEAQKDRRHDRLEAKCATVAARGITVGEGDDAKTIKFADPDDALVYIERALREGDVEEDDVFDSEGKVNTDALSAALGELLKRKPHLVAGDEKRSPGDPDARKGEPADNDMERMTPEDHARRKYGEPTAPAQPVTGSRRRT